MSNALYASWESYQDGVVLEAADSTNDELSPCNTVERTIRNMEQSSRCFHPRHGHSFQQVSFLLPLRKCAGCQQRVQTTVVFVGYTTDSSQQTVRCVACGAVAHRRCALSERTRWTTPCPVNAANVTNKSKRKSFNEDTDEDDLVENEEQEEEEFEVTDMCESELHLQNPLQNTSLGNANEPLTLGLSQPQSPSPIFVSEEIIDAAALRLDQANETIATLDQQQISAGLPCWGKLSHSAKSKITTIALPKSDSPDDTDGGKNDFDEDDDEQVHVTPLHFANHPFASVSRAIQENVLFHFQRADPQRLNTVEKLTVDTIEAVKASVGASSTLNKTNNTSSQSSNIGVSTLGALAVAGGIAGGIAGMAIAGPAGAYASYFGMTGTLGIILEGSVSVGVIVASAATGARSAHHIKEHLQEKQRILTMGESGASRKVLLVRPNIRADPVWDQITSDAHKSAPIPPITGFTFLNKSGTTTPERYKRDSDIILTDEDEISTNDKVLLLVGRLLSDKTSVPGHVYRYLIDSFRERCKVRETILKRSASIQSLSPRARRDDVHAIIKHVTATLLDVRPDLSLDKVLTELTATAVEGLVFGQLYDLVFEEIVAETAERDKALFQKIGSFDRKNISSAYISNDALYALRMLSESHTPSDKLFDCVKFLERLSSLFEAATDRGPCADSLLKMACQHMIVANLADMNAEVGFLEEFARDEQLLRGREGYSLVTLQASLHFLNMSEDLEADIFGQDDDEENVPMTSEQSSSYMLD